MATFIAIVRGNGPAEYAASFPDFPECVVVGRTLDVVLAKAREALLAQVERLLDAGEVIGEPTAADAIERRDALFLAVIEVPDNGRTERVEINMPALSLARIDSIARRHGLTRAALFAAAVDLWALAAENGARDGGSPIPALSEFGNPLELKVEEIASHCDADEGNGQDGRAEQAREDVTSELERLLDAYTNAGTAGQPPRKQHKKD